MGRAIAGLLPPNPRVRVGGSIRFEGREMVGAPARAWDDIRSRTVGMIFQDPSTFLNPVMKVGQQVFIDPIAAAGKVFVLTDNATLVAIK